MAKPVPESTPDRVKQVVERIQGLPTLPSVVARLNQMILDPLTSAKEVGQTISSDPSLASRVLRVVNSSFYGFPTRISTVTHAIVILGFNTVKSIVLSSAMVDTFGRTQKADGLDRVAFWKHSIGCGAAARTLGRRLGHPALEELFIAGLLHDVGKVLLDQHLHEEFSEVRRRVRQGDLLISEAEAAVLGVTHADVGAWLFEKWNLSKGLVETTRCHHNPSLAGDHQRLAELIHVADILARALRCGSGGDALIPALSASAWNSLGLRTEQFDELLRETGEEIEKAMVFMDFLR